MPVSSPEIAELAKLVENTFRFINISFINEMALLCDRLGVNVWEVIEAAKTKPFAFMPHYPSPGVGGHCIPVVPQYLQAAAHEHGLISELIPAANRINEAMPKLVVNKLEHALQQRLGKSLINASVLLVGITYKPDIADIRESAAIRVFEEALSRGARVGYHDPLMPTVTRRRWRRSSRRWSWINDVLSSAGRRRAADAAHAASTTTASSRSARLVHRHAFWPAAARSAERGQHLAARKSWTAASWPDIPVTVSSRTLDLLRPFDCGLVKGCDATVPLPQIIARTD